jgi:hypothetical protein
MEIVILIFLAWIAPILICSWLADRQGKDMIKVFACSLFLGWIGGILALLLLPGGDPHDPLVDKWAREDAELEKQRNEAALRAMGKLPAQQSQLTPERRSELEKLIGGKKKSR